MGEIPSDLLNFRKTVEPSLSTMTQSASTLASKFDSLLSYNEVAKKGVDASYQSGNKDDVLSSYSSVNSKCNAISNAFSGDLSKLLTDSKKLCNNVQKLDEINTKIDGLKNQLNITTDEGKRLSIQEEIRKEEEDFEKILKEAKSVYSGLKSFTGSLKDFSKEDTVEKITAKLTGRSFKLEEFVVNGQKMRCYVYRPIYDGEVKLPVMEFMYGLGFENTGDGMAVHNSLGKLINEGVVLPDDAMVVIPIVQNGRLYESKGYRDLLAQLPLEVAKKYNGDTDRISLGGTSYGAVTAYRLVNEHPGRFSAIMAVYGAEEVTDAFKGMKVLNYTGRGGGNHTDLNYIKRQTEKLKEVGADVTLVTYDDTWNHSNTGTRAFSEKKANGEFVVEDVLRYSKKNKTAKSNT